MAYGLKYELAYYRRSGKITTIDIYERDYSGSITELVGGVPPLVIEGDYDDTNIYEKATLGFGIKIKVVFESLAGLNFFTEDPQKFIVEIYNGESSCENLIWQGFLNADLYSEDYSCSLDKPITLYGSDGMTVLDSIRYLQSDGSYYEGIYSLREILDSILNKLNITFDYLYTNHNLVLNDEGSDDILNDLYIANANFVDEKGVAMTCREVLDTIFGGLGLVMFFKGKNIYLIDPENLHDTSLGKVYNLSESAGNPVESPFGGYLDISEGDIEWFKTGTQLDVIPHISKAMVRYDPYTFTSYSYSFDDENNWDVHGSFKFIDYPSEYPIEPDFYMCSQYYEQWYTISDYYLTDEQIRDKFYRALVFKNWTTLFGSCEIDYWNKIAVKDVEYGGDILYFLMLCGKIPGSKRYVQFQNLGRLVIHTYSIPFETAFIGQDETLRLQVEFEAYVNTKNTFNLYDSISTDGDKVTKATIPIAIQVGDLYAQEGGGRWDDTETYLHAYIIDEGLTIYTHQNGSVNNKWLPVALTFYLHEYRTGPTVHTINGPITIKIMDCIYKADMDWGTGIYPIDPYDSDYYVQCILIRNITVSVIKAGPNTVIENNGLEVEGKVDTDYVGRREIAINTKAGTGVCGCSRGAFRMIQNYATPTYIKDGIYYGEATSSSDKLTFEQLILKSVVSQYKVPRFRLNGSLDVGNYSLDVLLKLIKDSNHLPNKSFLITSFSYDDRYESMEVSLMEITSTKDDII